MTKRERQLYEYLREVKMANREFQLGDELNFDDGESEGGCQSKESYVLTCCDCGATAIVCGDCLRSGNLRCSCHDKADS